MIAAANTERQPDSGRRSPYPLNPITALKEVDQVYSCEIRNTEKWCNFPRGFWLQGSHLYRPAHQPVMMVNTPTVASPCRHALYFQTDFKKAWRKINKICHWYFCIPYSGSVTFSSRHSMTVPLPTQNKGSHDNEVNSAVTARSAIMTVTLLTFCSRYYSLIWDPLPAP